MDRQRWIDRDGHKYTGFMAVPYLDLLAYCHSQQPWLRETIEALVRLESPSDDKAAVDRCGDELERRLSATGALVERLRQDTRGDHLRAQWTRDKGKGRREKAQGRRCAGSSSR